MEPLLRRLIRAHLWTYSGPRLHVPSFKTVQCKYLHHPIVCIGMAQDYVTQVGSVIHIPVSFVGTMKSAFLKIKIRGPSKIHFNMKTWKPPKGSGPWMERLKDGHFP